MLLFCRCLAPTMAIGTLHLCFCGCNVSTTYSCLRRDRPKYPGVGPRSPKYRRLAVVANCSKYPGRLGAGGRVTWSGACAVCLQGPCAFATWLGYVRGRALAPSNIRNAVGARSRRQRRRPERPNALTVGHSLTGGALGRTCLRRSMARPPIAFGSHQFGHLWLLVGCLGGIGVAPIANCGPRWFNAHGQNLGGPFL